MFPAAIKPITASSMSTSKEVVSDDMVISVNCLIPSEKPSTVAMETNWFLTSKFKYSATAGEMKSLSAPVSSKALINLLLPVKG